MKPIIWSKIILTLVIFSGATLAFADENAASTNQPPMLTSQQFVSDAAIGGMKEVFLSQLAQEKSTNADIKDFASRMVKDHSKANANLMKIATGENLDFPPTNTFAADDPNWNNPLVANPETLKGAQMLSANSPPHLADYQAIQRVKSLTGDQFDQAYADDMVSDHAQAVSAFETASQSLSDPKLKKFAGKTLPTLQKHYKMAQDLNDKYNMPNGTNQPASTVTPQSM